MTELTDFLRFVTNAGSAVIPWLLLSLATLLVIKSWPHFVEYIAARTEAQHQVAEREAERNEIMRNNSAVIRNNTETISMMQRFMEDRDNESNRAIEHHEAMSAERIDRMREVIDGNRTEIGKLRGDVGILLDRVKK